MDQPGRPDELTEEVPEEERPARIGSADELTDEVVDDGDAPPKIVSPRRRDATRATGGAKIRRRTSASDGSGGKNKTLMTVAGIVVIAVVAFFATRGGDDDGGGDGSADPSKPDTAATKKALSPGEEFAARFSALAPDDASGRRELLAFCIEHDLKEPLRKVHLEILLQDPNDQEARTALGFTRYTGDIPSYQGMWLTDEDLRLAQLESR